MDPGVVLFPMLAYTILCNNHNTSSNKREILGKDSWAPLKGFKGSNSSLGSKTSASLQDPVQQPQHKQQQEGNSGK
jgi:hypothetical protein